MPLGYDELEIIINDVQEKVRRDIVEANRVGMLEFVLDKYGMELNLPMPAPLDRRGDTILVLGALSISKDDLSNLFRKFKIKQKTFEFVEYDDVTNFNFSKLIENHKYTDIFVGPLPHKAMNIGNASSAIEYLLESDEIPAKISILRDNNGELKISKRTFKKALEESALINADYT